MLVSDIEIIVETDSFVVVNKPAGLLSIPGREGSEISLKELLLQKYGSIYTVHRLDRDTTGIILFAKDEASHKYFSQKFEEKEIEKFYVGLVHGNPANASGSIEEPIMEHAVIKNMWIVDRRGKPSHTDYEVLESFGKFSLVKFQIHTGRTHQIRVHAKHIGHPIAADPVYGDGKPVLLSSLKKKYNLSKKEEEERPILNRVALHSYQLKFKDAKGKAFDLIAEPPKDMRALLQQLRKLSK
jgi:23S rRNA pseudouridine1911/1915/1917 synthase